MEMASTRVLLPRRPTKDLSYGGFIFLRNAVPCVPQGFFSTPNHPILVPRRSSLGGRGVTRSRCGHTVAISCLIGILFFCGVTWGKSSALLERSFGDLWLSYRGNWSKKIKLCPSTVYPPNYSRPFLDPSLVLGISPG